MLQGLINWLASGKSKFQLTGSIPAGNALIGKTAIDQTTPGTTNAIVINAKKAKITDISVNSAASIAAAGNEEVTLNPTSGYMAKVLSLYLQADGPAGATTGTHQFEIYQASNNSHKKIVITAAYNGGIRLRGFDVSAGTLTTPTAVTELPKIYELTKFTAGIPLKCKYTNNTDATQTTARIVAVIADEEAVI